MPIVRKPGGWEVRLRYGAGKRGRFLIKVDSESVAKNRAERLQAMAARLASAGRHAESKELLEDAAATESASEFRDAERVVAELAPLAPVASSGPRTYGEVLRLWISGELHERYPDDVKALKPKTLKSYVYMANAVDSLLGHLPLTEVTEEHAEAAKAEVSRGLGQGSRRQYALMIRRVMSLAEHPLRLIERNPIRARFVPPQGQSSVFGWLYPSEDEQLMRRSSIEVDDRLVYGTLGREGFRLIEALRLVWGDIDMERGVITLDENKTDQPRAWRLGDDVLAALRAYRGDAEDTDLVFPMFVYNGAAERFRAHLWEAGVRRKQLHTQTDKRRPIRIHDLRATFITMAFACGWTEAQVMARTGHKTSQMLQRYHRRAATVSELSEQDRGWFGPLNEFLGLREHRAARLGHGVGQGHQMPSKNATHRTTINRAKEPELDENPERSKSEHTPSEASGPAEIQGVGQSVAGSDSPVEQALALALEAATAERRWDVVLELSRQLEARRLAHSAPNVASLDAARKRRDEGGK
jgi:integrase